MWSGSSPGIQPMAKLATVERLPADREVGVDRQDREDHADCEEHPGHPSIQHGPVAAVQPSGGRVRVGRSGTDGTERGGQQDMERLSGLDASFLYLETPSLHMHVALTLVFDPSTVPGGYSFDRMKRSIEARLPCAPVFRRRLVEVPFRLGPPGVGGRRRTSTSTTTCGWPPCPDPGGLRQLADLAGDITGRQLDRSRPLWEMWIVEGLADGRIGFIAKMHHSTVDGVSGAALLSVLFDLAPEPAPETMPPASSRSTPGSPRAWS